MTIDEQEFIKIINEVVIPDHVRLGHSWLKRKLKEEWDRLETEKLDKAY